MKTYFIIQYLQEKDDKEPKVVDIRMYHDLHKALNDMEDSKHNGKNVVLHESECILDLS